MHHFKEYRMVEYFYHRLQLKCEDPFNTHFIDKNKFNSEFMFAYFLYLIRTDVGRNENENRYKSFFFFVRDQKRKRERTILFWLKTRNKIIKLKYQTITLLEQLMQIPAIEY